MVMSEHGFTADNSFEKTANDYLKITKAQFGGIEATLQQSKSLFDKARSKHFHAHG